MKTLILTALVIVFGAQIGSAFAGTECHQCHNTDSTQIRIVREFK